MRKKSGKMTVAEAGRKGGRVNRDKYGHEHFVAIGKKGGAQVKAAFEALRRERSKGR